MAHTANLRINATAQKIFLKIEMYDENVGEEFYDVASRHVFVINRNTGAVEKSENRSKRETIALQDVCANKNIRKMICGLLVRQGA